MANEPSQKMKFKLKFIVGGFITLSFLILAFRIVYIACFAKYNGTLYSDKAYNQQLSSEKIKANRGTIYDRNMVPLAQSATVWTVSLSPNEIKSDNEKQKIIQICHKLFPEIDVDKLKSKCNTNRKYEIIAKKCEKKERDELLNFMKKEKIESIHLTDDTKRYYPQGDLGSHIVGFCGADNQGLLGLELFYNSLLSGTDGKLTSVQNGRGQPMPYNYESYLPARDGFSLITTIDVNVQRIVQNCLATHCELRKPLNRGCAIVMDAKNFEILALAVWPFFDLNKPFELVSEEKFPKIATMSNQDALNTMWRNKAISDLYEPGSTFKVVTGSGVYNEGLMNLNQTFFCKHSITVGPETFHCWKSGGHGHETFTQAFINSCNPAFIQMGAALGPQKFFQYFESFGMTKKTNIDLVGEAAPLFVSENRLGPVELASESFGQTAAITPLNMIKAFCTVINGGYDNGKPHLMSRVVDENSNVIQSYTPIKKKQIISKNTSEVMQQILTAVVDGIDNKGTNASVIGYKIAGKSGTAQKLSEKRKLKEGDKERYVPSFIGAINLDKHPITIMALIDSPTYPSNEYYGGVVAAPLFREIAQKLINYYNLAPDYSDEELAKIMRTTPKCEGFDLKTSSNKLLESGFENFEFVGKGDYVLQQIPPCGTKVNKNNKIMLYTEKISDKDKVKVPDVTGLTQTQANSVLANNKLNLQIKSCHNKTGRAISQTPDAGTIVLKGHIVEVDFVISDENAD